VLLHKRVLTRRWGIRRDHLIIILYRPLWSSGLLEMAPPVLPVRSCVQLLLRARTNIICTRVINESPSSGMMSSPPSGGNQKSTFGWHQKSFLGRQPPSSFGRTKKVRQSLNSTHSGGACRSVGLSRICSEKFCTRAKTLPRTFETCRGVTSV